MLATAESVSRMGMEYAQIVVRVHVSEPSRVSEHVTTNSGGRESVVGIATRYGLDGPSMESRWGQDFSQPFRPALGPTQPHLAPRLKKE
jgi:hypothetical protein